MARISVASQPLILAIGASALLNLAAWVVAVFLFPKAGPAAILHYSVPLGVDFIGESRQIYALPIIGLTIFIGNVALGWLIRRPSIRAAWMLWGALPGIQAILLIAIIALWQFNR